MIRKLWNAISRQNISQFKCLEYVNRPIWRRLEMAIDAFEALKSSSFRSGSSMTNWKTMTCRLFFGGQIKSTNENLTVLCTSRPAFLQLYNLKIRRSAIFMQFRNVARRISTQSNWERVGREKIVVERDVPKEAFFYLPRVYFAKRLPFRHRYILVYQSTHIIFLSSQLLSSGVLRKEHRKRRKRETYLNSNSSKKIKRLN